MNAKLLLLAATLLGGVVSASATTTDAHASVARALKFEAPAVASVISPTGLSRRHENASVTLSLTVDAEGRPHNIRIVSQDDRNLAENLLPAIAKWQFTPARKDGVAVETKVILPILLVDSSGA